MAAADDDGDSWEIDGAAVVNRGENAPSSRKKLLILDINGLLLDTYFTGNKRPSLPHDAKLGSHYVYKRPHCDEFVRYCLDNFVVGVWSSAMEHNVGRMVDFIFGDATDALALRWCQSHCTDSGLKCIDNKYKPLFFKELAKVWEWSRSHVPWTRGEYGPWNTLLIDDSAYKVLLNPDYTAILPKPYSCEAEDSFLLTLKVYLEKLRTSDNVQEFVKRNPIGQTYITRKHPQWQHYSKSELVKAKLRKQEAEQVKHVKQPRQVKQAREVKVDIDRENKKLKSKHTFFNSDDEEKADVSEMDWDIEAETNTLDEETAKGKQTSKTRERNWQKQTDLKRRQDKDTEDIKAEKDLRIRKRLEEDLESEPKQDSRSGVEIGDDPEKKQQQKSNGDERVGESSVNGHKKKRRRRKSKRSINQSEMEEPNDGPYVNSRGGCRDHEDRDMGERNRRDESYPGDQYLGDRDRRKRVSPCFRAHDGRRSCLSRNDDGLRAHENGDRGRSRNDEGRREDRGITYRDSRHGNSRELEDRETTYSHAREQNRTDPRNDEWGNRSWRRSAAVPMQYHETTYRDDRMNAYSHAREQNRTDERDDPRNDERGNRYWRRSAAVPMQYHEDREITYRNSRHENSRELEDRENAYSHGSERNRTDERGGGDYWRCSARSAAVPMQYQTALRAPWRGGRLRYEAPPRRQEQQQQQQDLSKLQQMQEDFLDVTLEHRSFRRRR